jgi:Domain of unknown function (DUF4278)
MEAIQMQLKYRGVTYDYNPPTVEMEPSGVVGLYRGLEWRFRNPKKVPVLQSNLDLKYRGVTYRVGQNEGTTPEVVIPNTVPTPKTTPVADLARALMTGHHRLIQRREQSMLGRAASEVGMGKEASHYWRPIQGKISADARRSYDRSAAAMS